MRGLLEYGGTSIPGQPLLPVDSFTGLLLGEYLRILDWCAVYQDHYMTSSGILCDCSLSLLGSLASGSEAGPEGHPWGGVSGLSRTYT